MLLPLLFTLLFLLLLAPLLQAPLLLAPLLLGCCSRRERAKTWVQ